MRKRQPLKQETKDRIRASVRALGNSKYTPEIRKKMSVIKKGQHNTPWNKGKKMVKEYCERISETLRGKTGEQSRNWKGGVAYFKIRAVRKRENGGSHTQGEWETLREQYNLTCPCCDKSEPEVTLTKDHIIPVSKGGSDNIENIQPLCRSCNAKKHTVIKKY